MRFFSRASVVRGGPDRPEVRRQRAERCWIDGGRRLCRIMRGDFGFDLCRMRQCLVPADLQFASHQPIGGVGGIVLSEGTVGGIGALLRGSRPNTSRTWSRSRLACFAASVAAVMAPGPTTRRKERLLDSHRRRAIRRTQCALAILPLSIQAPAAAVAWNAVLLRLCIVASACAHSGGTGSAQPVTHHRAWARRDADWWGHCC